MGPQGDSSRKNKLARKIRSRTPDSPNYRDLEKISAITSKPEEDYLGIERKVWREFVDVVYKKDLKLAMKEKRISVREGALLLAIFYNMGKIGNACFEVNIGYTNHTYWLKTNPVYKEFYQMINEHWVDLAEFKLNERGIIEGDVSALKLILETKGKERGYSKESLVTQNILPAQFIVDFNGPQSLQGPKPDEFIDLTNSDDLERLEQNDEIPQSLQGPKPDDINKISKDPTSPNDIKTSG